jgi:Fe-S cluster biogenesis protein NfuA
MYIFVLDVQDTALKNAKRFSLSAPPLPFNVVAQTQQEAEQHPLISSLWHFCALKKITLQGQFLTFFGAADTDWRALGKHLTATLKSYEAPQPKDLSDAWKEQLTETDKSLLNALQDILDQQVRPILQKDHGDIVISGFSEPRVSLSYQGSCRGCGFSSTATQSMIEQVIRTHFPEITLSFS